MSHEHSVYDTDAHFSINPVTRAISATGANKTIIQRDHNSERFSFNIPRLIEGHDMSSCDKVRIHYTNYGTSGEYSDIYEVTDMIPMEDDPDTLVFTWLVSGNSTQYQGRLSFAIEFACLTEDDVVSYRWNTAVYNKIKISAGSNNADGIIQRYPDILEQFKNDILTSIPECNIKTINGIEPDENGNIEIDVPEPSAGITVDDALELLTEMEIVQPLTDKDGNVYVSHDELLYIL